MFRSFPALKRWAKFVRPSVAGFLQSSVSVLATESHRAHSSGAAQAQGARSSKLELEV